MEAWKAAWDFIQNEILGMKWLNRLIGRAVEACRLDPMVMKAADVEKLLRKMGD